METIGRRRLLASGAAMMLTTGCGWILYPERRGRTGGRIDVPVLIIDLLWFIPGLVPGLVCLIVDFTTGCIYQGGGGGGASIPPPTNDARAIVEVELEGVVVATGEVQADRRAQLTWSRTVDDATLREKGRVVVRTSDGARAQAQARELIRA